MTSNPEISTAKNSQRITTRSQTKRLRDDEGIQNVSKKIKLENITLEHPSYMNITRTSPNSQEFDIIKRIKSTQDELKTLIKNKKLRDLQEKREFDQSMAEKKLERERLRNELKESEAVYLARRRVITRHYQLIQHYKSRIKHSRGEEVLIEGNDILFKLINEE